MESVHPHARRRLLARLADARAVDLVVVGGGATGLGCAVDAAARGYSTLLLEAHDFAQGTSSRSTKLIHGGVRYLAQGRIGLVREALAERATLLATAPHLVYPLRFVVPVYRQWDRLVLAAGLTAYDWLAGPADKPAAFRVTATNAPEVVHRLDLPSLHAAPSTTLAVTAMMQGLRVPSCERIRRVASRPSNPGMLTSINTTSKAWASSAASASSPSGAVVRSAPSGSSTSAKVRRFTS